MSTAPVTPEVLTEVTPVAEMPVVVPTPEPEQWYEYQPVDEHNRPVGGQQRFSYKTQDELIDKLQKAHTNAILGMREVKRKARLGTPETDALPEDLERLPQVVQFREKPLSTEERYAISQDMNDPAKFESARDRLLESAVGVSPAELRETLNRQQMQTQQIVARQNAEVWLERHPEFYACTENINTVCEWMTKTGLQPTIRNFEFAQSKMEEAGLLLSSPIVREVPPVPSAPVAEIQPEPQAVAVEPVRINETPMPQEKRQGHVPSGLNNRIAPTTGALTPSKTDALTLRDIDAMSSEEYRKQITTNPEFVKKVNELEAARPPKPRR